MDRDVEAIFADARQRLTAMADDPPFRFVDTTRQAAQAYREEQTKFQGYSDTDISAAETRLGLAFPEVFRGYLATFGVLAGDLLRGSSLVSLTGIEQFRTDAERLLRESQVRHSLPTNAVVFLLHLGYQFEFIPGAGGFDSPVFLYGEGDPDWSQWTGSFAEYIDSNIRLMETNHRNFHEQGGFFVSVDGAGRASQRYPALADGIRPLDGPDRFSD